ncbi:BRO family protein [Corynebacterium coyleae]|uniref:BRO family protein n=1 Tax=Corynebacterium coyleae TaxID=53374 RepID=UPI00254A5883|nr:phage antirepressor KilAC domain-containing protein [Corynebacterium coyleae]MDK8242525.1 BRO family protein [Corynebacterium coyleae]
MHPGASNQITPFDFNGANVRTFTDAQGEPWFVLKDVCDVLDVTNVGNVVKRLDKADIHRTDVRSGGQNRNMALVNESGLYDVILDSRKPQAREFRRWVTSEVIPSIRKTGAYGTPVMTGKELMAAALIEAESTIKELEQKATEMAPKAQSWEYLAAPGGDYGVAEAAKVLSRDPNIKVGRNQLFGHMHRAGWIFRKKGKRAHWEAYQDKAINTGRLVHKLSSPFFNERTEEWEQPAPTIRITPKGLHELHRLLGGSDQLELIS